MQSSFDTLQTPPTVHWKCQKNVVNEQIDVSTPNASKQLLSFGKLIIETTNTSAKVGQTAQPQTEVWTRTQMSSTAVSRLPGKLIISLNHPCLKRHLKTELEITNPFTAQFCGTIGCCTTNIFEQVRIIPNTVQISPHFATLILQIVH
jgi:hypothetical protein